MANRPFRFAGASILAVFVFLAGAISVDAAPPRGTPDAQACANGADPSGARPFTLAQARACAPGAEVLSGSIRVTTDGTFIVQRGKGYQVISRSTKPDTSRKADDPCFIGSVTVIDGGGIVEFLSAYLCYNYSVAWAYGVQANCYTLIPEDSPRELTSAIRGFLSST